jgi:quercetin dioxygenase-like cupin family protein
VPRRTGLVATDITVLVSATLAVAVLVVGVQRAAADHGLPHPELIARGSFVDDVAAQIRTKVDGRGTQVANVNDASDMVILKITIHDGAIAPWHTHTGPGLLINAGPGTLTSIDGDCLVRKYPAGAALVDIGQGVPHAAFNHSGQDLVLYATFVGVQGAPVISADPPPNCDALP